MDIKLIIGDSAIIKVAVVDGKGRPFDLNAAGLTNARLEFLQNNEIVQLCDIEVPASGNAIVFPLGTDITYPAAGSYPYSIYAYGQDRRYTILEGQLEFRKRLIDAVPLTTYVMLPVTNIGNAYITVNWEANPDISQYSMVTLEASKHADFSVIDWTLQCGQGSGSQIANPLDPETLYYVRMYADIAAQSNVVTAITTK